MGAESHRSPRLTNPLINFWKELRRRKVIRVAIVYAVVAWAVAQVSALLFPSLLLPEWASRLVVVLLLLGFPVALVLAWVLEISPTGLKRESQDQSGAAATLPAPVEAQCGPECPANAVPDSPVDQRRSIVVMPFSNMSGDEDNEYFSDGVTEEILNLLARQSGLRVVSRTTSFSFKNTQLDLRSIALKLGVETVLEGSVRRAGNRVRVVAQLIDARSDAHLWSNSYDRDLEDIFTVQAEIARCIVDAIHLEPGHCLECAAPTTNMQAYEYYLRGRQYFHTITQSGLQFARQMFARATEIDPRFARAYAGLADAESFTAQWYERTQERLDAADRASRKALELAPHLAEAHSSRGFALSLKGDFAAASREFERALELEPQNYEVLYLYGRARFAEGRTAEAAALWLRAHAAQPDEYQSLALRVGALRGLDHPDVPAAAQMAAAAIERRLELNPDDVRALYLGAGILSDLGRVQEGVALAERALVLAPDDMGVLYNTACSFARGGFHERALELLERRMQVAATIYREWVEHDSDFDGIKDDPRFIALLERMPRLAQTAPV